MNNSNTQIPHNCKRIAQSIFLDQSKLLGKGSTGNVYAGYCTKPQIHQIAIKAIDLAQINNEVTRYLLSCEISALNVLARSIKAGGSHVVKLYEVIFQGKYCYLAMEMLMGGTLAELIKSHPHGLDQSQSLEYFRQIMKGYEMISQLKIIHRDIKPDNLIFKHHGMDSQAPISKQLVFIDFGYCIADEVKLKPNVFYNVGSPRYMSPEAYKQNAYSEKSDIWAIGVILFEMLEGKTLDVGQTMSAYFDKVRKEGINLPDRFSQKCKRLIKGMLSYDVSNRFTCKDVMRILEEPASRATHPHFLSGKSTEFISKDRMFSNDQVPSREDQNIQHFIPTFQKKSVGHYFSANVMNTAQKNYGSPERNIYTNNPQQQRGMIPRKMVHVESFSPQNKNNDSKKFPDNNSNFKQNLRMSYDPSMIKSSLKEFQMLKRQDTASNFHGISINQVPKEVAERNRAAFFAERRLIANISTKSITHEDSQPKLISFKKNNELPEVIVQNQEQFSSKNNISSSGSIPPPPKVFQSFQNVSHKQIKIQNHPKLQEVNPSLRQTYPLSMNKKSSFQNLLQPSNQQIQHHEQNQPIHIQQIPQSQPLLPPQQYVSFHRHTQSNFSNASTNNGSTPASEYQLLPPQSNENLTISVNYTHSINNNAYPNLHQNQNRPLMLRSMIFDQNYRSQQGYNSQRRFPMKMNIDQPTHFQQNQPMHQNDGEMRMRIFSGGQQFPSNFNVPEQKIYTMDQMKRIPLPNYPPQFQNGVQSKQMPMQRASYNSGDAKMMEPRRQVLVYRQITQ